MCQSKKFSRSLYDKYNQHGIQVAVSFLRQLGYEPINFDEAYKSHDFIVTGNGRTYKVECEVTEKWVDHKFPYRFMSVPYRKKDSQADFYIRTNPKGTALFFMTMAHVKSAPVIYKNTTYTQNEPFFNVDTEGIVLFINEDNVWYMDNEEDDLPMQRFRMSFQQV
jgi:hypothetical protein